MTLTEETRTRVRQIEELAAKHDGIDPTAEDMTFSPDNPWLDLLQRARRNLAENVQADAQHGALIIRTLPD